MSDTRGVVVLGMHRSGTSMIAELVHRWGAQGRETEMAMPTTWNPRGYWEYRPLVDLNRRLLECAGANWCAPPATNDTTLSGLATGGAPFATAARDLVLGMEGSRRPWFWKDPRLCVLLPFWRGIWGNVRYVICVRNPEEVVESLVRRNGLPRLGGILLWHRYMWGIVDGVKDIPNKLVVSYNNVLNNAPMECERLFSYLNGGTLGGENENARLGEMLGVVTNSLNHGKALDDSETADMLTEGQRRLYALLADEARKPTSGVWFDKDNEPLPSDWQSQLARHSCGIRQGFLEIGRLDEISGLQTPAVTSTPSRSDRLPNRVAS